MSETLEAITKADQARVDGRLQRSLAASAGDGTARDAIEFDEVRRLAWLLRVSLGRLSMVCSSHHSALCQYTFLPAPTRRRCLC